MQNRSFPPEFSEWEMHQSTDRQKQSWQISTSYCWVSGTPQSRKVHRPLLQTNFCHDPSEHRLQYWGYQASWQLEVDICCWGVHCRIRRTQTSHRKNNRRSHSRTVWTIWSEREQRTKTAFQHLHLQMLQLSHQPGRISWPKSRNEHVFFEHVFTFSLFFISFLFVDWIIKKLNQITLFLIFKKIQIQSVFFVPTIFWNIEIFSNLLKILLEIFFWIENYLIL